MRNDLHKLRDMQRPAPAAPQLNRAFPLRFGIQNLIETDKPRIQVEITDSDANKMQVKHRTTKFSIKLRVNNSGDEIIGFIYPDANSGSTFYTSNNRGFKVLDRPVHAIDFHGREILTGGIKRTDITWCLMDDHGINFGLMLTDAEKASVKTRDRLQTATPPTSAYGQARQQVENAPILNASEIDVLMNGGDIPELEEKPAAKPAVSAALAGKSEVTIDDIVEWRNELERLIATFNAQDNGQKIEATLKLDVTKVVVQHMSL